MVPFWAVFHDPNKKTSHNQKGTKWESPGKAAGK